MLITAIIFNKVNLENVQLLFNLCLYVVFFYIFFGIKKSSPTIILQITIYNKKKTK